MIAQSTRHLKKRVPVKFLLAAHYCEMWADRCLLPDPYAGEPWTTVQRRQGVPRWGCHIQTISCQPSHRNLRVCVEMLFQVQNDVKRISAVVIRLAEPHHRLSGTFIYLSHNLDLATPFVDICLVDAD